MPTPTILVIEDDRAVAMGLTYSLATEGYGVLLATTGQDGIRQALSRQPDLIILDLRLPDIDGFTVCARLRASGLRLPILMLTVADETADKVRGLEAGADDYLTKPFELAELLARIRALLRRSQGPLAGGEPVSELTAGPLRLDLNRQAAMLGSREIPLTATEFRLLTYLARHSGQTFSRTELLQAVWGYEAFVGDERTVDVHILHLRQKLEDESGAPRLIHTVRGAGYRFGLV